MTGRVPLPVWAAEALLVEVRAELDAANVLLAELDVYIAQRKAEVRHQKGRLRGRGQRVDE